MFNNICIFYWLIGSICKPTFTFSYENNEPIEIIQMQGKKKGWTKERSTTCHFKESTNRERSNHQMITDMLTFFILRYGKKKYIYFTYKAKKKQRSEFCRFQNKLNDYSFALNISYNIFPRSLLHKIIFNLSVIFLYIPSLCYLQLFAFSNELYGICVRWQNTYLISSYMYIYNPHFSGN